MGIVIMFTEATEKDHKLVVYPNNLNISGLYIHHNILSTDQPA